MIVRDLMAELRQFPIDANIKMTIDMVTADVRFIELHEGDVYLGE